MIEIRNVYKFYGGKPAVANLTLEAERGDILGFIGPNGAGKTTTIRMMATLLAPDSGSIKICGIPVRDRPMEVRGAIGYMPDEYGLYDEMNVEEYLLYCASLMNVERGRRKGRVDQLLDLLNLGEKRATDLHGLSKGMRNRVFLAKALIHDPQVLILDEPASGLDPRARIEFRETLKQLSAMGKTIFISSHILTEMDQFCNKVAILEAGRLVLCDTVEKLQRGHVARGVADPGAFPGEAPAPAPLSVVEIRVLGDDAPLLALLGESERARSITKTGDTVRVEFDGDDEARADLLRDLLAVGCRVVEFAEKRRNLEDVFLRTTTGTVS